ncbi:hypothetical protein LEP1GSC196_2128 [Leptospira meyeri serovar Semaranga str. Veldrot Semarang 173]|nr:hypothetical protein LEP1GSC196_2128 [Leptospira meyeri serovar Semaranga str. Veldrot Semarang 173]
MVKDRSIKNFHFKFLSCFIAKLNFPSVGNVFCFFGHFTGSRKFLKPFVEIPNKTYPFRKRFPELFFWYWMYLQKLEYSIVFMY